MFALCNEYMRFPPPTLSKVLPSRCAATALRFFMHLPKHRELIVKPFSPRGLRLCHEQIAQFFVSQVKFPGANGFFRLTVKLIGNSNPLSFENSSERRAVSRLLRFKRDQFPNRFFDILKFFALPLTFQFVMQLADTLIPLV